MINTQFYKKSFARVLCFILMKDIGRFLYKLVIGTRVQPNVKIIFFELDVWLMV